MSRRHRLLVLGLLLGLLVRAVALPLPGTVDAGSWKIWSFVGATDATGIYGVGGSPPERRALRWHGLVTTTDYPPLSLYELSAIGKLYRAIDPLYRDSVLLTMLLKAPGILAELLLVVVLLGWGRRVLGNAGAKWAAMAVWLNPAIILNGSVQAYLDAQMAVPAVLALVALVAGLPVVGGALAAAAVLTKVQAIFILPVLAVVAGAWTPRRRAWDLVWVAAGGCAVATIVLLPIVARGAWPNMVQAVGRLTTHNMLSGYALNAWWVLTWVARVIDSWSDGWWSALTLNTHILQISDWSRMYPNPRVPAACAVLLAWAWAAWRARRSSGIADAALVAGWCVYAYTMFAVQVHENHLYLAVPCLAVAAGADPRLRPLFYAVSAMATTNLYLFYGFGDGWPPVVDRGWTVIDMSVLLSLVNIGVFVWATSVVARRSPALGSVPDAGLEVRR